MRIGCLTGSPFTRTGRLHARGDGREHHRLQSQSLARRFASGGHGRHNVAKANTAFNPGTWLGRETDSSEHIIGTSTRVLKTRSIRRGSPSKRWQVEIFQSLKRVPWDLRGDGRFDPTFFFSQPSVVLRGLDEEKKNGKPSSSSRPSAADVSVLVDPDDELQGLVIEEGVELYVRGAFSRHGRQRAVSRTTFNDIDETSRRSPRGSSSIRPDNSLSSSTTTSRTM